MNDVFGEQRRPDGRALPVHPLVRDGRAYYLRMSSTIRCAGEGDDGQRCPGYEFDSDIMGYVCPTCWRGYIAKTREAWVEMRRQLAAGRWEVES